MRKKATILIVEDDLPMLQGLEDLFGYNILDEGKFKFEVLKAQNGKQGLKTLEDHFPDIIIADINMPVMNGYEFLSAVRKSEAMADVPFIFLTARGVGSDIINAMRLKVDAYITKPFDSRKFVQLVEDVLQLHLIKKNLGEYVENSARSRKTATFLLEQIERIEGTWLQHLSDEIVLEHQKNRKPSTYSRKNNNTQTTHSGLDLVTAGIVHDLRNGLGVIRNTTGFLKDELTDNVHQSDIQKISYTLDYLDLIIRNLQSIGDEFTSTPKWINIEKAVRDTYLILKSRLVDVVFHFLPDPDVQEIWIDEGQLKQLLMNLIKNAGEAMPEGGTLIISTKAYNDHKIKIEIKDTGVGLSKADQQKIFNEPFTTKEKGRGVGLKIVQSIIKTNKGTISVISRRNEGATFTVILPIGSE